MGFLDFIFSKKIPKPDFVQAYEVPLAKPTSPLRKISQLQFTVLDTETTGLDVRRDEIVSFGAVKVKGYVIEIKDSMEVYLKTDGTHMESTAVHQILHPADPISKVEFCEAFLSFIGTDILVGHHLGFDIQMLEKTLQPFGLSKILNPLLDTHSLALRLEKGPFAEKIPLKPGEYALDEVCARYGIPLDDRHTAAGDAFLTAQLLMKLLKLAEQKGISDFKSLMR
jgi:DNA polymerase-3 subunit epsilon